MQTLEKKHEKCCFPIFEWSPLAHNAINIAEVNRFDYHTKQSLCKMYIMMLPSFWSNFLTPCNLALNLRWNGHFDPSLQNSGLLPKMTAFITIHVYFSSGKHISKIKNVCFRNLVDLTRNDPNAKESIKAYLLWYFLRFRTLQMCIFQLRNIIRCAFWHIDCA